MPTLITSFEHLRAVDILEYWDEFTTIQLHIDIRNNNEFVIWTTHCEMCRSSICKTIRTPGLPGENEIIDSHPIFNCTCDDYDIPNNELPGMWDESDFLGGPDYNDSSNFN